MATLRVRELSETAVPLPDGVEKLVFRDDSARMMNEKLQDLEDFGLEGQDFSGFGDGEVALVDLYVGKPKDAAPMLHRVPRKNFINSEG